MRHDDDIETRIHAHALGRLSAQESADLVSRARGDAPLSAELVLSDAMVKARAEDPARGQSVAFGWARLSRAIDAEAAARRPTRFSGWRAAAAMVVAVAAWQFATAPQQPGPGGDIGYGPAGAPASQALVAQVAFRPQATEAQIRAALLAANASIVSGPSALGLYELAFADLVALQAGVARLRAEAAVVESIHAEPSADSTPSSTSPTQP